jgi:hypothetical protein
VDVLGGPGLGQQAKFVISGFPWLVKRIWDVLCADTVMVSDLNWPGHNLMEHEPN